MFDVDPFDKFMALLTGVSGGGKSVAIASFLELGSIYFLDFDGRMASVSNWYKKRGLKQGQLTYDTIGPDNLYFGVEKLNSFIDYCPHVAVAVDSFTAMTVTAVMYSLKSRIKKGGLFVPTESKGNMVIPDWDEYKGETVCATMMLDMCKAIAAKGIKVFWTAHPITSVKITAGKDAGEKDKYAVQTRYAAYGQKTDSLIPIYFNEVYNLTTEYDWEAEKNKRWIFTQPNGTVGAKTALDLPFKMNWTDKSFYQVLMANLKGEVNEVEPKKLSSW